MREFQNVQCGPALFCLPNLDLAVVFDDHILPTGKSSPYTNIGIGMLVFIRNKICSLS